MGDAVLNMPDFTLAVRQEPARANRRSGGGPADHDVALCRDGSDDHQRHHDHLRRADLGSVQLVGRFTSPVVVAISMFTAVVATLAVNIAANVVSPANDFANAFPRLITFKTGGLITGLLGIVIQPCGSCWRIPPGYIFTWLLGYSAGWDRLQGSHRGLAG
jgi:NCS1 family nucleobase:cation symporter-1